EDFELNSEGQPGVETAKAIFRAGLASVNEKIEEDVRAYREGLESSGPTLTQDDIERAMREKEVELKAAEVIPEHMDFQDVERIIEIPIDLKVSMGMEPGLADFIQRLLVNDDPENPGLVTIPVRDAIAVIGQDEQPDDIIQKRIFSLIGADTQVSKLIIGGTSKAIGNGTGKWVVRATDIESAYNLITGTANGTNLGIYERGAGKILKLVASIRIQWGSRIRVTVSNGLRTQDFDLLDDDGRLIEVSKPDENNIIKLPIKGDYVSLGGDFKRRPEGMQGFESEVIMPSMKFKIRHADAHSSDGYLMLSKKGQMTGWMPIAEAVELGKVFEGASGAAMIMTENGLVHVSDMDVTEELLTRNEEVYVYMGVKNLVRQTQLWMDLLDVRTDRDSPRSTELFDILDILDTVGSKDHVTLRAACVMLLLRLKEGLGELPKEEKLKGELGATIALLRTRVNQALAKLNSSNTVIEELKEIYLSLGLHERGSNAGRYVLLGNPEISVRPYVEAGSAMIMVYRLEEAFQRMSTWDVLKNIEECMAPVYRESAGRMNDIMKRMSVRYRVNAKTRPIPPETVRLDEIKSSISLQKYMRDELFIPDEAALDAATGDGLKGRMLSVTDAIIAAYLKPTLVPEIMGDDQQTDIIDKLRKVEPGIFFTHNGKEYIHSLQWIKGNLKEDKFRPVLNISGDVSSRLDFIFNSVFKFTMRSSVEAIISEEDRKIVYGIGAAAKENSYRLVLLLDPIDGSSQIGEGGSFGSIFALGFLRPGQDLKDGSFDPRRQVLLGFQLQYGPGTQMTMVTPRNSKDVAEAVHFELNGARAPEGAEEEKNFAEKGRQVKEQFFRKLFVYPSVSAADMSLDWDGLMPQPGACDGIQLALGGSLTESFKDDGHREFITWLVNTYGYEPQYTGALVNDIIKIILSGLYSPRRAGLLHTYPKVGNYKDGRFRYAFEGIFYALLFRILGGEVSDGNEPLLNTKVEGETPSRKHIPFYAGSTWITKLRMSWAHYLRGHLPASISDDSMKRAWVSFLTYYGKETKRLMREIGDYSETVRDARMTEGEIREALLAWDGESIGFVEFLGMRGEDVYKLLFPGTGTDNGAAGGTDSPPGAAPQRPAPNGNGASLSAPAEVEFYGRERLDSTTLWEDMSDIAKRIKTAVMGRVRADTGKDAGTLLENGGGTLRAAIIFADGIVDGLGFFDFEEAFRQSASSGRGALAGGAVILYGTERKCAFLAGMIAKVNEDRAEADKIRVIDIREEGPHGSEAEEMKAVTGRARQAVMSIAASSGKPVIFVGLIKGGTDSIVDITADAVGEIDMPIIVMDNVPGVHSFRQALLMAFHLRYNVIKDNWLFMLKPIEILSKYTADVLSAKLLIEIGA
ncbi:MAG: hypothetical protein ABH885_00710, partial [Candidatus Omnitrophota bacterium]